MISKVLYNLNILPSYYKLGLSLSERFSNVMPGQFVMLRISEQFDPLLRRPFGIYNIQGQRVEILYKVVGRGTGIMSGFKNGDKVDIIGPLGNSFPLDRYKNIIMVAGGIGIVPFYLLMSRVKAGTHPKDGLGSRLKLLFGGKSQDDLPGLEDFKKLKIGLKVSTDDGSVGKKGMVTELIEQELRKKKTLDSTVVYACGPKPMLKTVAEIARKNGVPCYVSLDSVMACGMGACLGCAVKVKGQENDSRLTTHDSRLYKMVCKDGPVFNAKEIDWEMI